MSLQGLSSANLNWRCVPSPQSKRKRSGPHDTKRAGWLRCLVGNALLVPRKVRSIFMDGRRTDVFYIFRFAKIFI